MSIIIGSARIGENGSATGGISGDQTGNEVGTQEFYMHSRGWVGLRAKSAEHAKALANAMKEACNNQHIGYNQDSRDTCFRMLKKYGSLGAIKEPCNTDCSALVRCCIYQATGVDLGDMYTGNMADIIEHSPLFKDRFNVNSSADVYDGDILVTRTKGHTVIVISGRKREVQPMYNSFLEAVEGAAQKARGWIYGDSSTLPPCEYETKHINGRTVSGNFCSCDRLEARALWDLDAKYRDQAPGGFTTFTIEKYLTSHGWYKNTNINKIKDGDIVLMGHNSYPDKANEHWHVFTVKKFRSPSDIDKYDAGNQDRMNIGCFFGHVPVNEWSDRFFYCSFSQIKPSKPLPDNWSEYAGYDRYDTGAILAKKAFDKPKTIVLVSGENYPDALSAYGYAGQISAPVIMTQNNQLSTATYHLLKEWNSVEGCIVVGKAINGQALGLLFNLGINTVTVCGGANRQETAEMMAKYQLGSDTVVVCSGDSFADAASIAPWLYKYKWPVLFAIGGKLTDKSKELLNGFDTIYVIGGENAVNDAEIPKAYRRLSGLDRFETSKAVAMHFGNINEAVVAVSGSDGHFADAIASAQFASKMNAPVVLADNNAKWIVEHRPRHGYIVGALDRDIIADEY